MNHPAAIEVPRSVGASRLDTGMLELHLKNVIASRPRQARLAETDNLARMWFVSELAGLADGRVPLTEIEDLVSLHIPAAKGGGA